MSEDLKTSLLQLKVSPKDNAKLKKYCKDNSIIQSEFIRSVIFGVIEFPLVVVDKGRVIGAKKVDITFAEKEESKSKK